MNSDIQYGTVVSFSRFTGYGFVLPDRGGADIFLHRNHIKNQKHLDPGDRIKFVVGEYRGREIATDVQVIGHIDQAGQKNQVSTEVSHE